ncbi:hypothetical protein ACM66B_006961 [Microbotryomycetes sp. NB124-2]
MGSLRSQLEPDWRRVDVVLPLYMQPHSNTLPVPHDQVQRTASPYLYPKWRDFRPHQPSPADGSRLPATPPGASEWHTSSSSALMGRGLRRTRTYAIGEPKRLPSSATPFSFDDARASVLQDPSLFKSSQDGGSAQTERVATEDWRQMVIPANVSLPLTPPISPTAAYDRYSYPEPDQARPRPHRAYTCASSQPASTLPMDDLGGSICEHPWTTAAPESAMIQAPLTSRELERIATLHNGRVPRLGQTAPTDQASTTPLINTGNTGPMVMQDGDWTCACGFVNWRRRRVCLRCFPFSAGGSDLLEKLQRAKMLAGE